MTAPTGAALPGADQSRAHPAGQAPAGTAWTLVVELVRRRRHAMTAAVVGGTVVVIEVAARPVLVSRLARAALVDRDRPSATALAAALTVLMAVGMIAEYGRAVVMARAAEAALADLRAGVVRRALLPDGRERSLLGTAINDTAVVARELTTAAPGAVGAMLSAAASALALLLVDVRLAAVVGTLIAVVLAPLTRWYRRRAAPASEAFFARYDELVDALGESAAGASVAWRYGRPDLADRFDGPNRAEGDAYRAMVELSARYGPATAALRGACTAASVAAAAVLVPRAERVPVLAGALVALPTLFGSLGELTTLTERLTSGRTALARLAAIGVFAAPRSTARPAETAVQLITEGLVRRSGCFTLGPIDLALPVGVTAIVGATGAGKSTLARLLGGLEHPDAGSVRVEHLTAGPGPVAGVVSLLPQHPAVLPGTVGDNLRLVCPLADDETLGAVVRRHGLGDWLDELPDGLATMVGDTLSEGSRRVVGLVQVLLRDPGVVVLDEPTTALDPLSAARVERASMAALHGRVVVLITHSLASARRAERIAVLAHGRLVGLGTHEELVVACAEYRHLHGTP